MWLLDRMIGLDLDVRLLHDFSYFYILIQVIVAIYIQSVRLRMLIQVSFIRGASKADLPLKVIQANALGAWGETAGEQRTIPGDELVVKLW